MDADDIYLLLALQFEQTVECAWEQEPEGRDATQRVLPNKGIAEIELEAREAGLSGIGYGALTLAGVQKRDGVATLG
jgi:hypothetical protein